MIYHVIRLSVRDDAPEQEVTAALDALRTSGARITSDQPSLFGRDVGGDFDYAAVSGSMAGRAIEYVDHLHEHFLAPVRVQGGRYLAPTEPGIGAEMYADSVASWQFPSGPGWAGVRPEQKG